MTDTTASDSTNNDIAAAARELREAAGIMLPGSTTARAVPDAPHLLRVTTADGDLVVRRWEPGATAERITFIASALDHARDAGITTVPRLLPIASRDDGRTLLLNGRLYTVATWQDGRPFSRYGGFRTPDGETIDIPVPQATPAEEVTIAAATALGRFHTATRDLAVDPYTPRATMRAFLANARRQWARDRRVLGDKAAGSTEIRRWLRCGNRVMAAGGDRLDAALAVLDDASTLVHTDLWPTHLLISGGAAPQLTGITGWASLAYGSALLDLAQLAVHVQGWSAARAEAIIGAYHDAAPLSPEQRRTLPVVAALDLVSRVARLIELAYIDERMIGHDATPVLRGAIRTLLPSLETLTNVLVPPEPRRFQPARSGAGSRGEGSGQGGLRRSGSTPTRPAFRESTDRSPRAPRPGRPKKR